MKFSEFARKTFVLCLMLSFTGCAPSLNADITPTVPNVTVGFLHPQINTTHPAITFTDFSVSESPMPSATTTAVTRPTKAPWLPPTADSHQTVSATVTGTPNAALTPSATSSASPTADTTATPSVTAPSPRPTETPRQTEVEASPTPLITFSSSPTPPQTETPGLIPTPSATMNTSQKPTESPTASPSSPAVCYSFRWNVMPSYFEDYLGFEQYRDMLKVIDCLSNAQDTVTLDHTSSDEQWDKLRRAIQICFVPWRLLYDPLYLDGGPFEFNVATKILTVRYNFGADGKEGYLKKLDDFSQKITQIMERISDISNKEQAAHQLFLTVSENLEYKDDGRLTVYDAIMENVGYCQTFSQMYRYLLWQADIPCYLCSGELNHEWNIIKLEDDYFYVDTTWQSTSSKPELYYFGFCTDALKPAGYGQSSYIYVSDELKSIQIGQICNKYCKICKNHD